MNKYKAYIVVFISSLVIAGDDSLLVQIHQGEDFLKRQVYLNHHYMACQSSGAVACPLFKTGQVFLAAFIAEALAENMGQVGTILVDEIKREQRSDAWGYAPNAPLDADDTAFALQALWILEPTFREEKVKKYLDALQHFFYVAEFAAYTTFIQQQHMLVMPAIFPSTENNQGIHPEVNANIGYMLHLTGRDTEFLDNTLLQFQAEDGSWYGYFYPSRFYSSYMFARYFCRVEGNQLAIQKTIKFIEGSRHSDGSFGQPTNVYTSALAINTLLVCAHQFPPSSVHRSISYLLQQQKSNGSWQADKEIIWEYKYANWSDQWWRAYDVQNILVTALAVKALKSYSRLGRP